MIRGLQYVVTFATKDFDKTVLVCFILANKHSQSKVYEYCSAVDGTKCQMKCPGSVLYSCMYPTLGFKVMNLLQEFVRCCSLLGRSIFCLDPSFRSVRKKFFITAGAPLVKTV